jgi:hypothetical protein
VTNLDWVIAAVVVLSALGGYRRGLIRTVFWLVGLTAGAVVGARLAPHLLAAGTHSRYTAAVGLVGAFVGVAVCQLLAALGAKLIRGGLHLLPPLHLLDSLGGLARSGDSRSAGWSGPSRFRSPATRRCVARYASPRCCIA